MAEGLESLSAESLSANFVNIAPTPDKSTSIVCDTTPVKCGKRLLVVQESVNKRVDDKTTPKKYK